MGIHTHCERPLNNSLQMSNIIHAFMTHNATTRKCKMQDILACLKSRYHDKQTLSNIPNTTCPQLKAIHPRVRPLNVNKCSVLLNHQPLDDTSALWYSFVLRTKFNINPDSVVVKWSKPRNGVFHHWSADHPGQLTGVYRVIMPCKPVRFTVLIQGEPVGEEIAIEALLSGTQLRAKLNSIMDRFSIDNSDIREWSFLCRNHVRSTGMAKRALTIAANMDFDNDALLCSNYYLLSMAKDVLDMMFRFPMAWQEGIDAITGLMRGGNPARKLCRKIQQLDSFMAILNPPDRATIYMYGLASVVQELHPNKAFQRAVEINFGPSF